MCVGLHGHCSDAELSGGWYVDDSVWLHHRQLLFFAYANWLHDRRGGFHVRFNADDELRVGLQRNRLVDLVPSQCRME